MDTRADRRRSEKEEARQTQYRRSGFKVRIREWFSWPTPNKYVPHIGAKQRAKGAAKMASQS